MRSTRLRSGKPLALSVSMLVLMLPGRGATVETAELAISQVVGDGWRADNITLLMGFTGDRPGLTVHVGALHLDTVATPIQDAQAQCPQLRLTTAGGECPQLTVRANLPYIGAQLLRGQGGYSWAGQRLQIGLRGFQLAGGEGRLDAESAGGGWRVSAAGKGLSLAGVLELLTGFWENGLPVTGDGTLDINVDASGTGGALTALALRGLVAGTSVSNPKGTLATDALGATLSVTAEPLADGWQGAITLQRTNGQLYFEPIFLDLTSQPVAAAALWEWRGDGMLELSELRYSQPGVVEATGIVGVGLEPLSAVRAQLDLTGDGAAYALYVRPWWFGTPAETLSMRGPVSGRLELDHGDFSGLRVAPAGLDVTDQRGRVEVAALAGELHWSADGFAAASELRWQAAQVYGLPIEAGSARFVTGGDSIKLPDGVELGTLGGRLDINELELIGLGSDNPDARFAARITGIDLGQLTAALGWPSFSGSLSGVLPRLTYRGGEAVVGGRLQAQAFDGDFALQNLRISGPFSELPQLYGDLRASNVDLEQLTRTVSFGRITGRADLEIAGLHLLAWSPVAFVARLATTPGDTSKHRISQQAIDNIAAVSGGPTGLLSSGFAGMFKEFGYAELGLQCRLEGGVCYMNGVGPAREGYYIVRGKGLPRIDVVGFRTEVDWPRLVKQLRAILRSQETPTP